jgi:hypothetical protein
MSPVGKVIVVVVLVVALACLGGGVFLIVERETGTRANATVTDCAEHGRFGTDCTGSWIIGGSLVGGHGRIVVGPIDGAVSSDVGKTIDVTVSGDHAYVRSLALPIVLLVLGLLLVAPVGLLVIRRSVPRERLITSP